MKRRPATIAVLVSILSLSACSDMSARMQRTLSGGAIGAAGGAAISAVAGGPILVGALVGGAAGATIGNLTSKSQVNVGH
jgi:hypothetical protein